MMKNLQKTLHLLGSKVDVFQKEKLSVSQKNIGWHIAHCIKVVLKIAEALEKSNPNDYKKKNNVKWFFTQLFGTFPRGKAKAPKQVIPEENYSKESLQNLFTTVNDCVLKLDKMADNAHFQHPIFGVLNKKATLCFLNLHTKHHLKIINDILK